MASYPKKLKNRTSPDLRLGIKSSFNSFRPVIASLYIIYDVTNKASIVKYSEEKEINGQTLISLASDLANTISAKYGNSVIDLMNDTPLFNSQIEALQVALGTFLRLAKVNFVSNHQERTGNSRYDKTIAFTEKFIVLDTFISAFDDETIKEFLIDWLNKRDSSSKISDGVKTILTSFAEDCFFKLRFEGRSDLIFNMESIYDAIVEGENVTFDSAEKVGPLRILNSYLNEGLHPNLEVQRREIKARNIEALKEYATKVSNGLDLIPREIPLQGVPASGVSVSDDAENSNHLQFLTAIRTKPFILLAGISGTGKSQIVRKLAQATVGLTDMEEGTRWENPRPRNFELIQVKPNWHNSMDVVGYKSNIGKDGEHYEFTPFVEFVAKAWQEPETPYFLCLDEMNLAPVEEYFAEFLSAIESRTVDAEGNYWTDPIIKPFKDFGEMVCAKMLTKLVGNESNKLAQQFREKGLTLPKNLIVMGTVNMDETTFSFSRKVLDRAMSIEMNEVDFGSFLDGASEQIVPKLTNQNSLFVNRPIKAKEIKDDLGEDSELIINYLTDINNLLEGTPFKLGYRSANEAMLYVKSAHDFGNTDTARALDEFTLMKILSRIEGDETKLSIEPNDAKVENIYTEGSLQDKYGQTTLLSVLETIIHKHLGMEQLASIKKLDEMIDTLHREHFVSYWV